MWAFVCVYVCVWVPFISPPANLESFSPSFPSLSYKMCQMLQISRYFTFAPVSCQMPSPKAPLRNHKDLRLTKWWGAKKYSWVIFADGRPDGCERERLQSSCIWSQFCDVALEKTNFSLCLGTLGFAQSIVMWLTICWRQTVAVDSSVHQGTNSRTWLKTLT